MSAMQTGGVAGGRRRWRTHRPKVGLGCSVRLLGGVPGLSRVVASKGFAGLWCDGGERRLAPCSSLNYALMTPSGPIFNHAKDETHFQQASVQPKSRIHSQSSPSRAYILTCSFPREHPNGIRQLLKDEESSNLSFPQLTVISSIEQDASYKISEEKTETHTSHDCLQDEINRVSDSAKVRADVSKKEILRRQKIGLANKGKKPWNKGRKHSQETRERIKKKTIEALSDPKVRKKMSECPRSHSDQSKARMSASLKRIWAERLKLRRSQEKCYLIWARCIAEAARKGDCDQQELEWDSYEKLKADIMFQHLQRESEKARTKEIARLRAEKAGAEKLAILSEQRKEKQKIAKVRKERALAQKSEYEKKKALSKVLARLTKPKSQSRGKLVKNSVSIQGDTKIIPQAVIENWDIEHIRLEKMRREVSLADQIRAAKNKKAEAVPDRTLEVVPLDSSVEEREGNLHAPLHSLQKKEAQYAGQLGDNSRYYFS